MRFTLRGVSFHTRDVLVELRLSSWFVLAAIGMVASGLWALMSYVDPNAAGAYRASVAVAVAAITAGIVAQEAGHVIVGVVLGRRLVRFTLGLRHYQAELERRGITRSWQPPKRVLDPRSVDAGYEAAETASLGTEKAID